MKASLIICTYNWPQALELVLLSVMKQSVLPDEVVIADDGSEDATSIVIGKYSNLFSVPIIHSWQEDVGCRIPHSRNRAIARANYEYIIMIDGDTIIHRDFIKDHKRFAQKGIYIQGSRVLLQNNFSKNVLKTNNFVKPSYFSKDSRNKLNMLRLPFLTYLNKYFKTQTLKRIRGCNFSMFKNEIIKVNGFNEDFVSWGREDSEFVQRLYNAGIKKQLLKFSGIQYHLFHRQSKPHLDNDMILESTIQDNSKWCENGINNYF
jgi:glycosyltransferase involved in cell wall biosynthesis